MCTWGLGGCCSIRVNDVRVMGEPLDTAGTAEPLRAPCAEMFRISVAITAENRNISKSLWGNLPNEHREPSAPQARERDLGDLPRRAHKPSCNSPLGADIVLERGTYSKRALFPELVTSLDNDPMAGPCGEACAELDEHPGTDCEC
jgi:hypothetical protein